MPQANLRAVKHALRGLSCHGKGQHLIMALGVFLGRDRRIRFHSAGRLKEQGIAQYNSSTQVAQFRLGRLARHSHADHRMRVTGAVQHDHHRRLTRRF